MKPTFESVYNSMKKFVVSPAFFSIVKYGAVAAAGYFGGPAAAQLARLILGGIDLPGGEGME